MQWFLIWDFACSFAQNSGEMLAFRFLSGLGACAAQSIGGGVLSDLWTSEERGIAVALYTLAPLLGPTLGPLMGAWIAEKTTWRWSFWAVTIFGTCIQVLFYFAVRLQKISRDRKVQVKGRYACTWIDRVPCGRTGMKDTLQPS